MIFTIGVPKPSGVWADNPPKYLLNLFYFIAILSLIFIIIITLYNIYILNANFGIIVIA